MASAPFASWQGAGPCGSTHHRTDVLNRPLNRLANRLLGSFLGSCLLSLFLISLLLTPQLAFGLRYTEQLGTVGSRQVIAEAGRANADGNRVVLSSDARLIYANMQLDAGELIYRRNNGQAEASGGFRLLQPELEIRGERLVYDTQSGSGELLEGEFELRYKEGHGRASEIRIRNNRELEMEDVSYTSCPMTDDGEAPGWSISASELDIDTVKGYGNADDVTLHFEGVPILYFPRFWFPAGAVRQTGFLAPEFGNSSQAGLRFGSPYYWNIADNYDATFTPQLYTKRGFQLASEFRYLHNDDFGIVDIELTPYDTQTNESRSFVAWQHYKQFSANTALNVDAAYASDEQYFDDFGSSLKTTSKVFLPQVFSLDWQQKTTASHWQAAARIESYQTLDETLSRADRPFRRLPALTLNGDINIAPDVQAQLDVDWTWFHHSNLANGQRLYVAPGLQWQHRSPGRQYTLHGALQYRRYQGNAGSGELTLPYFGADAQWTFVQTRQDEWLHTVTPRLAYRYRETQDQNDLPLFDTRLAEFGFDELFASNRFVGLDRLGDANQLGVGMVARWQRDDTDLRLSLGNIFYFERPEVGNATGNNRRSDWLAEFTADWHPRWRTRFYLQTNESLGTMERSTVQLGYRVSEQQRVSVAYRYQRETNFSSVAQVADQLEQIDIIGVWPVSDRWSVVGRWLQSLDSQRELETLAGFEYRSCCWTLRFASRRFVTDTREYNSSVLLQLELNGLGNIGEGLERFVRETP